MLIKQLLEVYDVLDDSNASGETVEAYLRGIIPGCQALGYAE